MSKSFAFILLTLGVALISIDGISGSPAVVVSAYDGTLVDAAPAGVITATSSQYIARNYNGIVSAAPVLAPAAAIDDAIYPALGSADSETVVAEPFSAAYYQPAVQAFL